MLVKAPRGISDQDYATFEDVDFSVLQPLNNAHNQVEQALIGVEDFPVDSTAQIAYALTQIDSMIYLLNRIKNEHLQEDK